MVVGDRLLIALLAVAFITLPFATGAQELDSVDKAFLSAVMNEPGKAQAEFLVYAEKNPLLTSYYVGLATSDRCKIPKPTDALYAAAGGDDALKTREGKWTFIVSVAVGSMKFPSMEDEATFCRTARNMVESSEAIAVKSQ